MVTPISLMLTTFVSRRCGGLQEEEMKSDSEDDPSSGDAESGVTRRWWIRKGSGKKNNFVKQRSIVTKL